MGTSLSTSCEDGTDVSAAIDAAETKPFGRMPFRLGGHEVGGHCLPIDPSSLFWWVNRGIDFGEVTRTSCPALDTRACIDRDIDTIERL